MTKPLTKPVSLSLPDDLTARIDRAASEFLQTRSSLVRLILTGWLANFEHASARETLAALPDPTTEATNAH